MYCISNIERVKVQWGYDTYVVLVYFLKILIIIRSVNLKSEFLFRNTRLFYENYTKCFIRSIGIR